MNSRPASGPPGCHGSRRGGPRRPVHWILVLPLATAIGAWRPALAARGDPGDPEGPGPLPWRVTGRVGFTVDAATFPDSTGLTLEVYLRVPPATLARLGRDAEGTGKLRLTTRVTNRFGGRPQER